MTEKLKEYDRIIMGIDPGTRVMGYGVLGIRGRKPEVIVQGVIKLDRFESHYLRLHRIYERVESLAAQYLPDEVLGEKFYEPSDKGYEKQIQEYFRKIKHPGGEE